VVCDPPAPEARQLAGRDAAAILRAVSEHDGLDRSALAQRGDPHIARAVAAWLCRRHSEVPLRELAPQLGLSRADSVPKQTRSMDARLRARSGPFCKDVSPPGTRLRVVLWMAHSTTTPHQPALAGQRA